MGNTPLDTKVVEAITHAFLDGITPKQVRGIFPGQSLENVVEVLGAPTEEHVNDLDGRILATYKWRQTQTYRGISLLETFAVGFHQQPAYGLTSVEIRVQTVEFAARETKEAFNRLKLRLLETFSKGINKSTFRAPGLTTEHLDEGFVTIVLNTHEQPFIALNCGVYV